MVRLSPPAHRVAQLAVDNVRLVDWDRPGCDYAQDGQPTYDLALSPTSAGPESTPVPARLVLATAPWRIRRYHGPTEE